MPSFRSTIHSKADTGSCISHSRLHVVVKRHHCRRKYGELLKTMCFPMSSITSLGNDSRPIMVLIAYTGDVAMQSVLAHVEEAWVVISFHPV